MANVRIVNGHAVLEVWPMFWNVPTADAACAVLRALWSASRYVMSVTLAYGAAPAVRVKVAIPADGSLDLDALQRDLAKRVEEALQALPKADVCIDLRDGIVRGPVVA